jgi:putative membrane protein
MRSLRTSAALALGAIAIVGCHAQPAKTKSAPTVVQQGKAAKPVPSAAKQVASAEDEQNEDRTADNARKNDKSKKRVTRGKKNPLVRQTSDADVIAMMLAYNNADMSYARIASARAQSAYVKGYATRMLTDHANVNARAMDLIDRSDAELLDNPATMDLREISAAHRAELKAQSGAAFDVVYMQGEVEYQRTLLAKIDDLLLPSSRHPELKKLVTSVRPIVAAHLAQAEQIGSTLSTAVGATR